MSKRIQELATLPVFFKLGGRRVVLAGGTDAALWKAEIILATGACLAVFSLQYSGGFAQLAEKYPNQLVLHTREWQPEDLTGAAIAIGAITDDDEAERFRHAAHAAGAVVNVIDNPRFCDFQFGAVVNRSPLVVAISTDGAAPVFAQSIRSLIEVLLPNSFKDWAQTAKTWRKRVDDHFATVGEKRKFWERFSSLALNQPDRAPADTDLEHILHQGSGETGSSSITIVDVGDDAQSMSIRSVRALLTADCIFHQEGVPAEALDFSRREATRIAFSLEDAPLAAQMAELAGAGKRVVCVRFLAPRSNLASP